MTSLHLKIRLPTRRSETVFFRKWGNYHYLHHHHMMSVISKWNKREKESCVFLHVFNFRSFSWDHFALSSGCNNNFTYGLLNFELALISLVIFVAVSTCPGTADRNELVAKSCTIHLFSLCDIYFGHLHTKVIN